MPYVETECATMPNLVSPICQSSAEHWSQGQGTSGFSAVTGPVGSSASELLEIRNDDESITVWGWSGSVVSVSAA
jgi:hypothetical protein